jgi:toxin ParE1/3/4
VNRYFLKPRADRDLDELAAYLASEASLSVAIRFLERARETLELIANHPEIGWHANLRHADLKSMRIFRIRGFERTLIFYRPISNGIEILRVVHGSRNLRGLFRRRSEVDPG